MSQQPNYRLYPSLLDRFNDYINFDATIEKPWNIDKLPAELEAEIENEIIDAINRVPFESEAAEKGTCFNNLIDLFIAGRPISANATDKSGNAIIKISHKSRLGTDYVFEFREAIVTEFADYFRGAASQVFCSGILETKYGLVELYGYIDELIQDTVFDIKTTSKYEFGKFRMSWQKHVYPFCLEQMGCSIRGFEYTVTDFRNTYQEWYDFNYDTTRALLKSHCERFIEFLEAKRDRITDKRIFNEQ